MLSGIPILICGRSKRDVHLCLEVHNKQSFFLVRLEVRAAEEAYRQKDVASYSTDGEKHYIRYAQQATALQDQRSQHVRYLLQIKHYTSFPENHILPFI